MFSGACFLETAQFRLHSRDPVVEFLDRQVVKRLSDLVRGRWRLPRRRPENILVLKSHGGLPGFSSEEELPYTLRRLMEHHRFIF